MCGICGIVTTCGRLEADKSRAALQRMLGALAHRGPDQSGCVCNEFAAIGAVRLAIRAPSAGRQPVQDPRTGILAVCNGEIDNHRELRQRLAPRHPAAGSAGDVDILPALYAEAGESFAEHLAGPFAVAIWDAPRRRLTLARDRAGERPLFYCEHGGAIWFATEVSALVEAGVPREISAESLQAYLRLGVFPAPLTPFAAIRKLAPGQTVSFQAGAQRPRRYWRMEFRAASRMPVSTGAFDEVFREAVRRQTDVNVPFGIFLSGGLDSSLLAAITRALHPDANIPAYILRFDEDSYDEGRLARRVARRLDLDAAEVRVLPGDFPAELARLVRRVGEPLADPAWIPTALLARRAAQDVRMALTGEGADELFGGYPTYPGARLAPHFNRLPGGARRLLAGAILRWPVSHRKVPVSLLLKRFINAAGINGLDRHRAWTAAIEPGVLARLGIAAAPPEPESAYNASDLDALQTYDLDVLLPEGLLTKADRAGMQSSIELRAPFLDASVLDFAATLPSAERVRGLQTKVFLKRYAALHLPRRIVRRRKRGLSVPLNRWLCGPLREWALSRLHSERLAGLGLRLPVVADLFAEHSARRADPARTMWTLIVLSEWLDWATERPRPPMIEGVSAST